MKKFWLTMLQIVLVVIIITALIGGLAVGATWFFKYGLAAIIQKVVGG